jgi:hypothetical protein
VPHFSYGILTKGMMMRRRKDVVVLLVEVMLVLLVALLEAVLVLLMVVVVDAMELNEEKTSLPVETPHVESGDV